MVVKSLEDNFEQKIAEELDQLQGNLETQKKIGLEEQHALQNGKEKANDSTEISENETENTDTESFGVPDEISIESFEQYENVEVGHLEKKIGSNRMQRVCYSVEEREQMREAGREAWTRMQGRNETGGGDQ